MNNKIAVITGISKGIGKAIGEKFEEESITVVGFSRTSLNGKCSHWVKGDMTIKEDRERLKKEVLEKYGKIDILVNNAGQGLIETWVNTSEKDLKSIFELNFFSMIELTKLFIPELKKTKGSIINVSSVLAKMPVPCMGGYCATKYAVDAFSDTLRMELKPYNVHVLNLTVGTLKTDFFPNCLGSLKAPPMPGLGFPNILASKVFNAYIKKKKSITYPYWHTFNIAFIRIFKSIYEFISIKLWKLDKING